MCKVCVHSVPELPWLGGRPIAGEDRNVCAGKQQGEVGDAACCVYGTGLPFTIR